LILSHRFLVYFKLNNIKSTTSPFFDCTIFVFFVQDFISNNDKFFSNSINLSHYHILPEDAERLIFNCDVRLPHQLNAFRATEAAVLTERRPNNILAVDMFVPFCIPDKLRQLQKTVLTSL